MSASWIRSNYWGGVGCSCNDGDCCRRCPRLLPSYDRCEICGNNHLCGTNRCFHLCCAQASPERVVERLEFIVRTLHRKLTVALGDELLTMIAGWLVDEPFAYGVRVRGRP